MLFCTLYQNKKNISLLFMINHISEIKIYSALNDLLEHPNKNLAKKHDFILRIMIRELKKKF